LGGKRDRLERKPERCIKDTPASDWKPFIKDSEIIPSVWEQGVAFGGDSRCRDQQNEKAQSGNFRAIAIEVAELRALRGAALNGPGTLCLPIAGRSD
jgi:hypothetical protein